MTFATIKKNTKYYKERLATLPVSNKTPTVREIVEKYRYIDGARKGKYRMATTPHMEEIAEAVGQKSDTRKITIQASAQSGKTAGAIENSILYYSSLGLPTTQLYISATHELVRQFVQARIEPMLTLAGVVLQAEAIKPNKQGSSPTGDTTLKKSYAGGSLTCKSFGNVKEIRTMAFQVIYVDEVDELLAKQNEHQQGSILKLLEARQVTYSNRKLILASTPLHTDTSVIHKEFLKGSQEFCHVACPQCRAYQKLEFENLKWEEKNNKVIEDSVYYACTKNACKITHADKIKFLTLENIKWVAENENPEHLHRSFNFNALYAPIGLGLTWCELAQQYEDSKNNADDLQVFYNTSLGRTFDYIIANQKHTDLFVLRGKYKSNTLPEPDKDGIKPLVTTLGVDVHKDRIEYELLAHGENARTWSIDSQAIYGSTENPNTGAWQTLYRMLTDETILSIPPSICFIDSGYRTEVVDEFCAQFEHSVYGVKGMTPMKDKFTFKALQDYTNPTGNPLYRVFINTNSYKYNIYHRLTLRKEPITDDKPMYYCEFPKDYKAGYFQSLTAQELVTDFDKKTGRIKKYLFRLPRGITDDHRLDCRVYAQCAYEFYAYLVCKEKLGVSAISWTLFYNYLKGATE